jgi:hypothetical protein
MLALGCGDGPPPDPAAVPIGRRSAEVPVRAETATGAHPARRCGECHAAIYQAWATSAHANADRSPIYRAMREASGRDDCDRCHAPLRARVPDERLAAEGVTCDVCHTLRAVVPDRHGTALALDLASAVRYGPLCGTDDHYFHRMGCSPLHSRAELCGGCHLWTTHTSAGAELDVRTTYADWQAGSHAAAGVTCQGCHMPTVAGEVAVGWAVGGQVSDHGMYGLDDRARALTVGLAVAPEGQRLRVELELTNAGAGHPLPSGLPGRRIVVRVSALGAEGTPIASEERILARILVDGRGVEVPFYAAQRVASDTCLAPSEVRRERLSLPRVGVVEVRAEVFEHALSATIAEAIGASVPEPALLTSTRVEVRAP